MWVKQKKKAKKRRLVPTEEFLRKLACGVKESGEWVRGKSKTYGWLSVKICFIALCSGCVFYPGKSPAFFTLSRRNLLLFEIIYRVSRVHSLLAHSPISSFFRWLRRCLQAKPQPSALRAWRSTTWQQRCLSTSKPMQSPWQQADRSKLEQFKPKPRCRPVLTARQLWPPLCQPLCPWRTCSELPAVNHLQAPSLDRQAAALEKAFHRLGWRPASYPEQAWRRLGAETRQNPPSVLRGASPHRLVCLREPQWLLPSRNPPNPQQLPWQSSKFPKVTWAACWRKHRSSMSPRCQLSPAFNSRTSSWPYQTAQRPRQWRTPLPRASQWTSTCHFRVWTQASPR